MTETYSVVLRSANKAQGDNNQFTIHLPEAVDPQHNKYKVCMNEMAMQEPTSGAWATDADLVEVRIRFAGYLYGFDSALSSPMLMFTSVVANTGFVQGPLLPNCHTVHNPNNQMIEVQLWDVANDALLVDGAGNPPAGLTLALQFRPIKE